MADPSVSVVIVSYNTREKTLACLRSLTEGAGRVETEVVLVDNASRDGSVAAVRAAHPDVIVIESGVNAGFARGVNAGVRQCSGDFVLLLNPDTVMAPGAIEQVLRFALARPAHGLYGGRTLRPDGSLDPSSCWGAPTLWSLLCFATGMSTAFHGSALLDPESLGPWRRDTVREVPVITGCFLLVRRDLYHQLGGLDPVFFLYGQDADFSMRAREAGWRPVIVPDAVVVHEVGASSSPGAKMPLVMAGKATLLRRRWAGPKGALGIRLLVVGVALRALLEVVSARRTRMWLGVWRRRKDWVPGFPTAERMLAEH